MVPQSTAMSTPSQAIADLRKSYERAELSEDASHADPLRQFEQWPVSYTHLTLPTILRV